MIIKKKKAKKKTKIVRATLGEYIKKTRLAQGYSQSELANILGYTSPQFISDWERGVSSPPVKRLHEIAEVLDVKVDLLFNLLVTLATEQLVNNLSKEFKQVKKVS
jgi:transcriptional regulator with XRE-family HTH domain